MSVEEVCRKFQTDVVQVSWQRIFPVCHQVAVMYFSWLEFVTKKCFWTSHSASSRFTAGTDQCQGRRVSAQGWSQCSHPSSHHSRMGQVLSPAVRWILHPAVDRRHPLLSGLRYPGSYRGRACRGQREQPTHTFTISHTGLAQTYSSVAYLHLINIPVTPKTLGY